MAHTPSATKDQVLADLRERYGLLPEEVLEEAAEDLVARGTWADLRALIHRAQAADADRP